MTKSSTAKSLHSDRRLGRDEGLFNIFLGGRTAGPTAGSSLTGAHHQLSELDLL